MGAGGGRRGCMQVSLLGRLEMGVLRALAMITRAKERRKEGERVGQRGWTARVKKVEERGDRC